jgi:hypothetical protein
MQPVAHGGISPNLIQRLTRAMIDNEIAEASNKRALEELEEARDAISRLTAHHARSVGLESRLNTVNQEMGDVKQERDSQAQRAKLAELRIEALNEKLSESISRESHLQRSRIWHRQTANRSATSSG